jgi:hypothetical protein
MIPQYDAEQMRAVKTHDILQRQQRPTPGTWVVGILLVIVAIAWMTLVVTRSHHTSVAPPPNSISSAAPAPRSVNRAR